MKSIMRIVTMMMAIVCWSVGAHAYGPFVVADDGSGPLQWQNNTVPWACDNGPLSSHIDNATAVQWVQYAMDKWANATMPDPDDPSNSVIQVADVTHVNIGNVDVDLTEDNLADYYEKETPNLGGLIVFDVDGSIISNWFDPPDGILGLTMPYGFDATGKLITRGIIILNGLMADQYSEAEFRAALLHEVGHLYNLDHSQVNWDVVPSWDTFQLGDSFDFSGNVPTMYPNLVTFRQGNTAYDDEIGIGWVYPTSDFDNKYCTITGRIKDSDGNPLQGVYVKANVPTGSVTPRVDARGMVSGAASLACSADGTYTLRGIRPGRSYQVTYEPLRQAFTGASGFEPFIGEDSDGDGVLTGGEMFPPYDFVSGTIPKGSSTTVSCGSGGEVIEMDDVQLDVENPCAEQTTTTGGDTSGTPVTGSAKSGMCSLSPDIRATAVPIALLMVLGAIIIIAIMRERRC